MTPAARLESIQLACELALLFGVAMSGCIAFGEWEELRQVRPDLRFNQAIVLNLLNGRAVVVGKKPAQVGLMCETF